MRVATAAAILVSASFTITWAFPTEFARRSANAELEVVTPLHEITVVRRQGDPYGPKKHPPNKDRPKDPPNNNSTPGNQKTKPPATTRDIGVGFDAEVMSPSEIIHVRLQERDPGVPDCGSKGDCPKEHPGKGHPDQGHPDPPNNNSTPGKQKTKPHAMARDVDITISEPINSHLQQRDPGDTPLIRPDRSQGHLPTTHNSKSDPRSGNGPDSIKKKNPPTAREVDTEFNVDSSTPSLPSNPSRRLPRDADVGPVIDEAATSLNVRNIGIDLTMADAGTPASKAYLGSRDVGPKGPKNPASAPKKPPPSVEGGGTVAVIGPSPDHRHEPSQPKKPPKARGISINSDKADVKASLAGPVACKEGEKDCSKSNPTPKEAPTQKKPAPKKGDCSDCGQRAPGEGSTVPRKKPLPPKRHPPKLKRLDLGLDTADVITSPSGASPASRNNCEIVNRNLECPTPSGEPPSRPNPPPPGKKPPKE